MDHTDHTTTVSTMTGVNTVISQEKMKSPGITVDNTLPTEAYLEARPTERLQENYNNSEEEFAGITNDGSLLKDSAPTEINAMDMGGISTISAEEPSYSGVDDNLFTEDSSTPDLTESSKMLGNHTDSEKAYLETELNVTLRTEDVFKNDSSTSTNENYTTQSENDAFENSSTMSSNENYTTEPEEDAFENFSTMSANENLTTVSGKGNAFENSTSLTDTDDYSETQLDQFTVFMIQKQCNSNNNSGGEVFDNYSELKALVEEVDDCLYFAFIKVKAHTSTEIQEAMQKFEAEQFHVIKVNEKAGNQAKTRLILKAHLDCKECLGKDNKLLESDLKDVKDVENIMYDGNNVPLYLAVAGSVFALCVVIGNIYLCYFRRKKGCSEIPSFSSKPEKFNMGPIPRPTILNGDNMALNHYMNGRAVMPSRKTEEFGERCHLRNENRGAITERWKAAANFQQKEMPFTENPMFGAW